MLYLLRFTCIVKEMTTTISSKGQITVPVEIREALGLAPGTRIDIRLGPSGTFLATKAKETSFFAKFKGVAGKRKVPYGDSIEAMDLLRGNVSSGDVD
jgi:AbrB family looped-hinge helix DNA binding protein